MKDDNLQLLKKVNKTLYYQYLDMKRKEKEYHKRYNQIYYTPEKLEEIKQERIKKEIQ